MNATPMTDSEQKPRRHRWDNASEQRFAATDSQNAYNAKRCSLCGMTKYTVIPPHGFPWHEWATADGKSWSGDATPPCFPLRQKMVAA
jgi:hypothetical protein